MEDEKMCAGQMVGKIALASGLSEAFMDTLSSLSLDNAGEFSLRISTGLGRNGTIEPTLASTPSLFVALADRLACLASLVNLCVKN